MRKLLLISLLLALSLSAAAQPAFKPEGEVHIPVVPVAFADVPFSFEDIGTMLNAMLNEELKAKGLIVIQGRTDRNYFMKRFFTEDNKNVGLQG